MKLEIELLSTRKNVTLCTATLVGEVPDTMPFYIAYRGLMAMLNRESIEFSGLTFQIKLDGHILPCKFVEEFTKKYSLWVECGKVLELTHYND